MQIAQTPWLYYHEYSADFVVLKEDWRDWRGYICYEDLKDIFTDLGVNNRIRLTAYAEAVDGATEFNSSRLFSLFFGHDKIALYDQFKYFLADNLREALDKYKSIWITLEQEDLTLTFQQWREKYKVPVIQEDDGITIIAPLTCEEEWVLENYIIDCIVQRDIDGLYIVLNENGELA